MNRRQTAFVVVLSVVGFSGIALLSKRIADQVLGLASLVAEDLLDAINTALAVEEEA